MPCRPRQAAPATRQLLHGHDRCDRLPNTPRPLRARRRRSKAGHPGPSEARPRQAVPRAGGVERAAPWSTRHAAGSGLGCSSGPANGRPSWQPRWPICTRGATGRPRRCSRLRRGFSGAVVGKSSERARLESCLRRADAAARDLLPRHLHLFLLLRLVLKRQVGQMARDYQSITDGILLVVVIVLWAYTLDWIGYRVEFVGRSSSLLPSRSSATEAPAAGTRGRG